VAFTLILFRDSNPGSSTLCRSIVDCNGINDLHDFHDCDVGRRARCRRLAFFSHTPYYPSSMAYLLRQISNSTRLSLMLKFDGLCLVRYSMSLLCFFGLIIAHVTSSSYSLISLPPGVLITISLLLPAGAKEIASAGREELHPDGISSGMNHRVSSDSGCKLIRCEMRYHDDGQRWPGQDGLCK
jgi:hypothetical protein